MQHFKKPGQIAPKPLLVSFFGYTLLLLLGFLFSFRLLLLGLLACLHASGISLAAQRVLGLAGMALHRCKFEKHLAGIVLCGMT